MTSPSTPTAADPLRAQANAAAARRDWPAATDAFAALAAAAPDDPTAWIALAKAADLAGRMRTAADAAARALALGPRSPAHALALARALRAQHDVPALRALADAMAPWRATMALPERIELADLLGGEDAHDAALGWLDDAVARAPDHAPAWYLRGTTRLFAGDFAGARADLEQAIALAAHFAHAHWRLSELRAHDRAGAGTRIDRLRREREGVAPGSEHDIHFSYALHAELHDLGDHDEAWAALERGMRGKRAALRYDSAVDTRLFAAIARTCDAAFVRGPGVADDDGPQPVFIVGLFRSGTTVLERLLAGHPDVADGGESLGFAATLRRAIDHRGPELLDADVLARAAGIDFAALGRDFLAGSRWRAHGRCFWTEKLPSNFLNVGLIARALPRARFVHMRRPAIDVCFSNLRTLYGGIAKYSYDQREMAAYHCGYESLMAHWRDVLGDRLLDVDHGGLLRDPEAQARRLLAHVGLAWDPRVLALQPGGSVSTASAAQVRGGLRAPGPAEWLPYRNQLQPLISALEKKGTENISV